MTSPRADPSATEWVTSVPVSGRVPRRQWQRALAFSALAVCGVLAVLSTAAQLYAGWMHDPLRSIGGLVPFVSLALILRVWRALGWAVDGDRRLGLGLAAWCGLLLLTLTIAAVHLRDVALAEFIVTPALTISLPPHQAVALAYVAGITLVAGGWRLLRAAWFPVLLIVLVIPVPNLFVVRVDLPLQHAAAVTARAFAHLLGQPLSADQLKLMFTPQFGMFIAPGCDGIRGSVTMGILALIAGYVYRLGARTTALMTAGGLLLGYIFNLIRLCSLVVYYVIALHVTWLQSRAEMGDYVIGALLFFLATVLLFTIIQKHSAGRDLHVPPVDLAGGPPLATTDPGPPGHVVWWRAGVLSLLLLLGAMRYAPPLLASIFPAGAERQGRAVQVPLADFPRQVGGFTLARRWNESLVSGQLIFYWAEYTNGSGADIALGLSPVLGAHDTLLCHVARGEDWIWHGSLTLPTQTGPTEFSGSFFSDGSRQYLEATTLCMGETCGQHGAGVRHFGLSYSRPDAASALIRLAPQAPIPVLLRAYTTDTHSPRQAAKTALTAQLTDFSRNLQLPALTRPYRQ